MYDGNDSLLMRFGYADARMPVAVTKDGATYYLAYDQAGTLKAVADASGNVIKKIEYDSFGNIINGTNPDFAVPFGFAGGLYDKDTGLVRFGYRDYDPGTGRWTAKDPIGFAGGDTDLYGYCLNDPVNWIDPWGLSGSEAATAGRIAVKGGVSTAARTIGAAIAIFIDFIMPLELEDGLIPPVLLNENKEDNDKPCEKESESREKGDRWKSGDDELQQLEEIEKAQQSVREGKIKKQIDSIEKSKQRAKHKLDRIKSLDDALD